jgi:hypothetical protein
LAAAAAAAAFAAFVLCHSVGSGLIGSLASYGRKL